jgi:NADPH2:quinone reductase
VRAVRAHAYGGAEVLRLEEVPDPQPGPGQVVIRIRAAGVNPVDTYVLSGAYSRRPDLPYTPGGDGAGDVMAVGEGADRFRPGDRVYFSTGTGAWAERLAAPVDSVWPLPDALSHEQGAAVGIPYATAWWAIHGRAAARPAEWLLVHGGSGAVGSAAIQIARAHGLRVIATAGTAEGRRLAADQGAHHVLDHGDPDHLAEAVRLTGGHGLDVILEMRADLNLGRDLTALAMCGRVVVVGSRGAVEINPRDTMGRDAAVLGMTLFNAGEAFPRIHAALAAGFALGVLRPVIGRRFPLSEVAAAHKAVLSPGALGKIVLIP